MPTYDYECRACGHRFEKFQSITAKPVRKCPACGKSRAKRLIGNGAGIIFKGSGFYQTDYRSDSYRQAAAKESPPSSGSASGESASSSTSDGASGKGAAGSAKDSSGQAKAGK